MPVARTRSNDAPATPRTCPACEAPRPEGSRGRFCATACRVAFHKEGVPGVVAKSSLRKNGGVAVTLHFNALDREAATAFIPGKLARIIR